MLRSIKYSLIAASLVGSVTATSLVSRSASADVSTTGKHGACKAHVAVREYPDGPARDNLEINQTFVVQSSVGGNYVYGYKLVNGVHGWVLSDSIDKSCLHD